ncbi:MAG: hypothetical protein O7C61_12890, partial [SAR324 cluster bacterium]|nr:hypothetical protein [SAR324 cluster bacterium]
MKTGLNLLFRRPADSPWMRLALLAAALCFLNGGAMAQELQLLHREGDLFAGSGEQPVAEDKRTFSRDTLLRVGQTVPPALAQALLATPPASGAAVLIAPGQVVTLVQGAAMQVKQGEEGSLDLELSGTAHILLEAAQEAPPLKLYLAGRVLETSRAVLFYNGWAQPPRLTVVTGGVKLAGPKPENIDPDKMAGDEKPTGGTKPAAEEKPTKADAAGGAVLLKEGDMVALGELPSAPESTTEEERQLQRWAELAGFTAPGPYKRVGVALSSDEKLLVERYGEEAGLSGKAIVILEGDKLRTHKPQQVLIRFDNKDRIKLFG